MITKKGKKGRGLTDKELVKKYESGKVNLEKAMHSALKKSNKGLDKE